jgi:hypothetical protein
VRWCRSACRSGWLLGDQALLAAGHGAGALPATGGASASLQQSCGPQLRGPAHCLPPRRTGRSGLEHWVYMFWSCQVTWSPLQLTWRAQTSSAPRLRSWVRGGARTGCCHQFASALIATTTPSACNASGVCCRPDDSKAQAGRRSWLQLGRGGQASAAAALPGWPLPQARIRAGNCVRGRLSYLRHAP